jgi:hypothetical protein
MRSVADLSPEELSSSHRLHDFANEVRGKFLTGAAWIEMLLSDIIATYFCTNEQRRPLFFSEIAVELSLYRKTELLIKLLKQEFPTIVTSHPRLKTQLDGLRTFRNLLAHSHIDTSRSALSTRTQNEVTFIYYRNGKTERQKVTRADAQQRAKEVNQLRSTLIAIQARVMPRATS